MRRNEFDLEDFLEQMQQIKKMGSISELLSFIPGIGKQLRGADMPDDKSLGKVEAIIRSMTPKERRKPDIIGGSRKKRIAAGSGTSVMEVNRLLKQFEESKKMMKQMTGKMGKKGRMPFNLPF